MTDIHMYSMLLWMGRGWEEGKDLSKDSVHNKTSASEINLEGPPFLPPRPSSLLPSFLLPSLSLSEV